MKLPYSYKDITINQFKEIYPLLKEQMELDDWMNVLSKLSGLTKAELEEMPIKKLKNKLIQISFLGQDIEKKNKKYLRKNGRIYRAETNAENLSTAQYTSIKTFCQEGAVLNLDKLCAVIYSKLTWKGFKYDANLFKEACEDFGQMKVSEVYGVVFFCSKVLKYLIVNTEAYLQAVEVIKERELEIMSLIQDKTFWTSGDGTQ